MWHTTLYQSFIEQLIIYYSYLCKQRYELNNLFNFFLWKVNTISMLSPDFISGKSYNQGLAVAIYLKKL